MLSDVVIDIDGMPLAGQPVEVVESLMFGKPPGESLAMGVDRGGTRVDVSVLVEDLLPSYPAP
jgi:hypothetical protein